MNRNGPDIQCFVFVNIPRPSSEDLTFRETYQPQGHQSVDHLHLKGFLEIILLR
jgi:hypothetical protein